MKTTVDWWKCAKVWVAIWSYNHLTSSSCRRSPIPCFIGFYLPLCVFSSVHSLHYISFIFLVFFSPFTLLGPLFIFPLFFWENNVGPTCALPTQLLLTSSSIIRMVIVYTIRIRFVIFSSSSPCFFCVNKGHYIHSRSQYSFITISLSLRFWFVLWNNNRKIIEIKSFSYYSVSSLCSVIQFDSIKVIKDDIFGVIFFNLLNYNEISLAIRAEWRCIEQNAFLS